MSPTLLVIVAVLAHNLGSIMIIGGLVFVQSVYAPALAQVRGPWVRMRLRVKVLRLLFRWVWVGIGLTYASGGWAVLTIYDPFDLPTHLVWTLALSLPLLGLLAWGRMGLFRALEQAVKDGRAKCARQLYGRLDRVLKLSLLVAVALMLLGTSGAFRAS